MVRPVEKFVWVGLVVFGSVGTAVAAPTPSFEILSSPPEFGRHTEAVGISADGAVIIGKYFLSGSDPRCQVFGGCTRSFVWTAKIGAVDLGLVDGREAEVHALSGDGSLIVGEASSSIAYRRAFVWTAATGMLDIGTPLFVNDPDHSRSEAYGMSGDGSVIVGRAIPTQTSLIPESFRFTTTEGFEFLTPTLPDNLQSQANGVSADGAVVVGFSYHARTYLARAFRWEVGFIEDLGTIVGPPDYAFATSSDGSAVVGMSGNWGTAFRWTPGVGMEDLGNLGGKFASSSARALSADGSVVVGSAPMLGLTRAFRWTPTLAIEDLNVVLADLGVDTDSNLLLFGTAVSGDGTIIVGTAENLITNETRAYRAVIPTPVCAPITCAALGKNCGALEDVCGATLDCGACTLPQTCGGGGVDNVCGPCTPTTCEAQGADCGAIVDRCGSWLACGTCAEPQICGGAGTPNVCGTPPPIPDRVTLVPITVVGGNPSTGTVILSLPALQDGALVRLLSSNPTYAIVPPDVLVPEGQTRASFTVETNLPPQDTVSIISACLNGRCASEFLFITR